MTTPDDFLESLAGGSHTEMTLDVVLVEVVVRTRTGACAAMFSGYVPG
jgi:hypothetical protein